MEPLSIVVSIAELAKFAGDLITKATKYGLELKETCKDFEDLIQELIYLRGTLNGVEAFLKVRSSDGSQQPVAVLDGLAAPNGAIEGCRSALDAILKSLQKCEDNPGGERRRLNSSLSTKGFLTWPFTKEVTEGHLKRVERFKCTFTLAISADNGYQVDTMAKKIDEMAESLKIEQKTIQIERERALLARIRSWLSSADMVAHHDMVSYVKSPGTNKWLFRSSEFKQWSSLPHGVLWVHAQPGAGKTVLMSSAIDVINNDTVHGEALTYFYCDNRDVSKQDSKTVMGSLVGQLCVQNAGFSKHVKASSNASSQAEPEPPSVENLQNLITLGTSCFKRSTIVIDAIDECRNREILLPWLFELSTQAQGRVRLLISSRQEVDILAVFQTSPQIHLSKSNMTQDIELMIVSKVRQRRLSTPTFLIGEHFRDQVINSLVEGASGNFQRAKFHFDSLCFLGSDEERSRYLDTMDFSLDKSYGRVFESITTLPQWKSDLAKWLLRWLACSSRPIKYKELMAALQVSRPELFSLIEDFASPQQLLEMFCGLVRHNSTTDIVSFSHLSVKEYTSTCEMKDTGPESFKVSSPFAHSELATICVRYILRDDLNGAYDDELSLQKTLGEFNFLDYAAKSWMFHAQRAQIDASLDELIVTLLTRNRKEDGGFLKKESPFALWAQVENYKKYSYSGFTAKPTGTPFTTAIDTKRWNVVAKLINDDFHFRDNDEIVPLHRAAARGPDELVRLLLENGSDPNETGISGGTALHLALKTNRVSTVKVLLDSGANPHMITEPVLYGSALSYAMEHASLDTITFLVKSLKEGTIDSLGGHCGTSLQKAAGAGRLDALEVLLEYGANVDTNLSQYGSAVQQATVQGHRGIVKCLVDRGANVNTLGECGSPLQAAILYKKTSIALLLLNLGMTDCNLDTGEHGNALQQALMLKQTEVAAALISKGALGDSDQGYCKTALEAAVIHPDRDIIQTLLRRNPDKLHNSTTSSRILQRAILAKQLTILVLLLQKTLYPDGVDECGWTPYICARHLQSEKETKILEESCKAIPDMINYKLLIVPTYWDATFVPGFVSMSPDRSTINYDSTQAKIQDDPCLTIYANAACPPCGSFYFEIMILFLWTPHCISVGLASGKGMFQTESYWYSSYGFVSLASSACGRFPRYETRDTVGCGYMWEKGEIFFTRNGARIEGGSIQNVRGKLFPML